MRRLLLIRHGETEWNRQRRVQGHSGSGLTATGVAQAGATAAWLADVHPDAQLVSSDLQRCRETVAPIAAVTDRVVAYDPQLRERSFGDWEGRLLVEIEADDRDRWERWRRGEDVVGEVGGEPDRRFADRVVAALRGLLARVDDGGTVAVVTHGGPVWHGTGALLGLPRGVLGPVANAAVTELRADADRLRLGAWNQTAHLPAGMRTTFRPERGRGRAPLVGR